MQMFGLLSFILLVFHTSASTSVPGLVNEIIHVEKKLTISPNRQACGALKNGELLDESLRSMILVSEPKSWMEALKQCRDRYVDLASLSSAMEQHTDENKVEGVQSNYVWIGLNFLVGSWIWVYGDNIQCENWVNGGKLQCPVAHRCGALTVSNGKWEAKPCEERLFFLCFQT
uniref:C-type lectin domain-containing protein n=1 Tax=Sinocyclocheilus rhinocerous TaxID=307959 RepID=A0A673HXA6_9TELE